MGATQKSFVTKDDIYIFQKIVFAVKSSCSWSYYLKIAIQHYVTLGFVLVDVDI